MKVRNYQKPMNALRVFDDFFNRSMQDFFGEGFLGSDQPSVNVLEKDDAYILEVAAPGMKKSDFEVHVDNGVLRIKAETEHKSEDDGEKYMRREFSYQRFTRSFALPENVSEDLIQAGYEDGVLRVELPKSEPTPEMRKTIEIS